MRPFKNISADAVSRRIAANPDAIGAIVIVLGVDGALEFAMSTDSDTEQSASLIELCDVVQEHCRKVHRELIEEPDPATIDATNSN